MISLQRSGGSSFLPYPQNVVNQHHHHHNHNIPVLLEKHSQQRQDLEDNMPWFARPVGSALVSTPGLSNRAAFAPSSIRDKEFVSSSIPTINMANGAHSKTTPINGARHGVGSSNSTLSRSVSPSSAEESCLNRSNPEDNYYSFYPSNNEEEKIRSAHIFLKNVRENELQLPEGKFFIFKQSKLACCIE